ncbi:hypothetical protein ISG29_16030 [Nocardioides sp. CBS4Y-1]|uniref:Uncharacterized protein n=1 Tax=Nocardioides acrostichi TaxID=2784339 RepID=A0A930UYH2_9ACTN|nr:hypothetical protein [Nocardioides acrostichi]
MFSSWALEDPSAAPLEDGSYTFDLAGGRHRSVNVRALPADLAGAVGLEAIVRDQVLADPARTEWATVIRVVGDGTSTHTWVENRVESDDPSLRVQVGRPRLVDQMLDLPGSPILGGSRLVTTVMSLAPDEVPALVGLLESSSRTLPVVVCSEPAEDAAGRWALWPDRIARRVGGIALVVTLPTASVAALSDLLGSLAVWGGAVRTYLPGGLDANEGWRHRYVPGYLMTTREDAMIDRIVFRVAQLSTRRRVTDVFAPFTSTTVAPSDSVGGISEDEAEERRLELELAREEHDNLQRELGAAVGHLGRLKRALSAENKLGLFWETLSDLGNDIPDQVDDVEDAILSAETYLSDQLAIHADAPRELTGILTAPQAVSWGNTTWRGFRALAAFVDARRDGFAGNFYDWCKSGPPLGWPATPKKLSMTESETVRSGGLAGARMLPVDRNVSSSGRVEMLAHLKISEGGGNLAPRVYFYDDTAGTTVKVHVGFVGPHYLMPNTRS